MLKCEDSDNGTRVVYYDETIQCYTAYHYGHCSLGVIFALLFFFFCHQYILALYDSKIKTASPLARTSIIFDRQFLLTKIILAFLFNLLSFDYRWLACGLLFIISSMMLASFYDKQPHLNQMIHFFYFLLVSVFEWASIVVFINIIFESSTFDGGIGLFLLGIPVIIGILMLYPVNYITLLLSHMIKFNKGEDVGQQIRRYLFLYNDIEHSRKSNILLKGYAFQFETQCNISGCPLKKYLESISMGKEVPSFFLQHAEMLFESAIAKFPSCVSLRLSFCFFLLEYLNKKRKVNEELANLSRYTLTNEHQFIAFHFKKLMDEHVFDLMEEDTKIDFMSNVAYKKCFHQFKQAISNVTYQYIHFWSLLLNPNQNQEQLKTLSDFGSKIISETGEIQRLFDKLQKINSRDIEVIYYYSDFLSDILNKGKEASEYKAKLKDIEDTKSLIDDSIFFSLDITTLSSSDEYQFIVLSAQRENFGIISHISLGVCLLLGYAKNEIIGKHYELIMPEIFIKHHHQLLMERVNEFKKETVNASIDEKAYKPQFKSVESYAKTKARYLVKIDMKVALIITETQGIAFIAKMNKDYNIGNSDKTVCSILTNNNLIIQNFTVNSVNLLGINSMSMNNSVEITKLIKQFHEEYFKTVLDYEDMTPEQKISIKRQIINKMFRTPFGVDWKPSDVSEYQMSNKIRDSLVPNSSHISRLTMRENKMMLVVKDAVLGGVQEGYVFDFCKPKASLLSNQFSSPYVSESINNQRRSSNKLLILNSLPDYHVMKTFIPVNKPDFQFNPKSMAYVQNPVNSNTNFRDDIKEKAIQKIQSQTESMKRRKKEESEDNESGLTSIEESDNRFSSNSSVDTSKMDSVEDDTPVDESKNNSSSNNKKTNFTLYNINSSEDYYKVCFANIKYSIYSFEKKMVLEVANYPKKSQIEMKINDDKEQVLESKKTSQIESIKEDPKKEVHDKEKVMIKQIEYALVNGDSQPTITRFKWVCAILILYFFGLGVGWLTLLILTGKQIKEGANMVQSNYKLLITTLSSHIYLRELTLLDQRNYLLNDNTAIELRKKELLIAFKKNYNQTHNLNLRIVTSLFPLSTENKTLIFNHTIPCTGIKDDLTVSRFNLTLAAAIFEINTGSYHIMTNQKEYFPTNNYIFLFIYNMNNNISITLQAQIGIYLEELFSLMNTIKEYYYMMIAFGFALALLSYFLFSFAYDAVARRKESYLEVFFEINSGIIKNFLEKCELFTRKLQLDSLSDFISSEDTDLDDNLQAAITQSAKKSTAKKRVNSKQSFIVKIIYLLFVIGVILMLSLSLGYYLQSLNMLSIYLNEYKSLNDVFVEYEKLYKNFNEYLFDDTAIVENKIIGSFFSGYVNDFYLSIQEMDGFFQSNKDQLPEGFVELYNKMNQNDLCSVLEIEDEQCRDPLLLDSVNYGFSSLLSFFIEEIRIMKNEKINKDNERRFLVDYEYNLTLNGHSLNDKIIDKDNEERYYAYSPILLFNDITTSRIKVLFDSFIQPGFSLLNEQFIKSLVNYININDLTYIIISSFYLTIVLCLYLFIWKPFEHELQNIIFKTKSMLLIIPKDVLASLANIDKLLNINLIFNKNKIIRSK